MSDLSPAQMRQITAAVYAVAPPTVLIAAAFSPACVSISPSRRIATSPLKSWVACCELSAHTSWQKMHQPRSRNQKRSRSLKRRLSLRARGSSGASKSSSAL